MKRFLSVVILFVCLLSVAACGNRTERSEANDISYEKNENSSMNELFVDYAIIHNGKKIDTVRIGHPFAVDFNTFELGSDDEKYSYIFSHYTILGRIGPYLNIVFYDVQDNYKKYDFYETVNKEIFLGNFHKDKFDVEIPGINFKKTIEVPAVFAEDIKNMDNTSYVICDMARAHYGYTDMMNVTLMCHNMKTPLCDIEINWAIDSKGNIVPVDAEICNWDE